MKLMVSRIYASFKKMSCIAALYAPDEVISYEFAIALAENTVLRPLQRGRMVVLMWMSSSGGKWETTWWPSFVAR